MGNYDNPKDIRNNDYIGLLFSYRSSYISSVIGQPNSEDIYFANFGDNSFGHTLGSSITEGTVSDSATSYWRPVFQIDLSQIYIAG